MIFAVVKLSFQIIYMSLLPYVSDVVMAELSERSMSELYLMCVLA